MQYRGVQSVVIARPLLVPCTRTTAASPPERWQEPREHESLDERLADEQPDPALGDADAVPDEQFGDDEVGARRSGRLVAPDAGFGEDVESELLGSDVGIDGGAASAEEAAIHVIED